MIVSHYSGIYTSYDKCHCSQEPTGNDVLYVWTHLNLMGDDSPGPHHNITYDLGNNP